LHESDGMQGVFFFQTGFIGVLFNISWEIFTASGAFLLTFRRLL